MRSSPAAAVLRGATVALLACCLSQMLVPGLAGAGGISVDAGLTPAEGRWILRSQVRLMEREGKGPLDGRSMSRAMVPLVLVHGLDRSLTLGARQAWIRQTMSMGGVDRDESGPGDLYLFAKYKVYRLNTRSFTLGVAPTLGLEAPTGTAPFGSGTWDLQTGVYMSARAGAFAADLSAAYAWNGFGGEDGDGMDPGDEITLDLALAWQFAAGPRGARTLAPVLELSWRDEGAARSSAGTLADSGASYLLLSPGLKFSTSGYILEALFQMPVDQDLAGRQLESKPTLLLGVRLFL